MSYTIRDTPTLAELQPVLALDVRPEPIDIETPRARAYSAFRDRLGREPTAEDIEAEKARERAENPMHVVTLPGHVETTLISIGYGDVPAAPAFSPAKATSPGYYHNHAEPCGTEGCTGAVPRLPSASSAKQTTAPAGATKEEKKR